LIYFLCISRLAGGARTVPKLVIEKKGAAPVLLNESAEIVRFADETRVPGASTLFPDGKVEEIGSWGRLMLSLLWMISTFYGWPVF
jgi:hypothetical protein